MQQLLGSLWVVYCILTLDSSGRVTHYNDENFVISLGMARLEHLHRTCIRSRQPEERSHTVELLTMHNAIPCRPPRPHVSVTLAAPSLSSPFSPCRPRAVLSLSVTDTVVASQHPHHVHPVLLPPSPSSHRLVIPDTGLVASSTSTSSTGAIMNGQAQWRQEMGAPTDTARVVITRKKAIEVRPQQEVVMDCVYSYFFARRSIYICHHLLRLGHSFLDFHRLRRIMHSSKGLIAYQITTP